MPKKFDFISPDVVTNEIDESQLPTAFEDEGLLIVGRSLQGPAMQPIRVRNATDLNAVFGPLIAQAAVDDTYREGNYSSSTYGLYAARKWLETGIAPVTFVRLAGFNHPTPASGHKNAGWDLGGGNLSGKAMDNIAAYGLFVMASASHNVATSGSLAAIFYTSGSAVLLSGSIVDRKVGSTSDDATTGSIGTLIKSNSDRLFTIDIQRNESSATGEQAPPIKQIQFGFDPNDTNTFIRNVANCNPQKLKTVNFGSNSQEFYFVGETFETEVDRIADAAANASVPLYGIMLPLISGSSFYVDHLSEAKAASTGFFINRNPNPGNANSESWDVENATKLFKVHALHEGEYFHCNYAISISDLRLGTSKNNNSTFSLSVLNRAGGIVEKFSNLTLDPTDANFVGSRIGTQKREYDTTNKIFNLIGQYPNQSDYIRLELSDDLKAGLSDNYALPFGFLGPLRPKGFTLTHGSSGPNAHGDNVNTGTAAVSVLTIGDGATNPGLPSNGALAITLGDHGTFTTTFNDSAGSSDTSFSNNACTIDPSAESDESGTASRLLINLRDATSAIGGTLNDHYIFALDASNARSVTITITARIFGPSQNITVVESLSNLAETTSTSGTDTDDFIHSFVSASATSIYGRHDKGLNNFVDIPKGLITSFTFPKFQLTEQNTNGGASNYDSEQLFGVRQALVGASSADDESDNTDFFAQKDYKDIARFLPAGLSMTQKAASTERSFVFSLDEIVSVGNAGGGYYYESGSCKGGTSVTAQFGTENLLNTQEIKQFVAPFVGGFDGLDIREADPFSQTNVLGTNKPNQHYAAASIQRAIDIASNRDQIRFDVISIPGLTNARLTKNLITMVEKRADALAIIDVDDGYKETYENNGSFDSTSTTAGVASIVSTIKSRAYDSSYAATYFPRIRYNDASQGTVIRPLVPSSVAAIAVLAESERRSEPWFAPAGFNRGGLEGLGFSGPHTILTKAQRDKLYQENINPIARFGAIGRTVVFGQKTLQQTPSALDRVNVRRLMIYLKKRIGRVANNLLFDQNVQSTWNRFKKQAGGILKDVQSRFGVTDYKLILDNRTTTADLIDRNILYAKIFIKPARAIEYIQIDFIVSRTGIDY